VCRTTIPSLDVYGDNGHSYACFHPVDGPKPVEVIVRSGQLAPVEVREHAAFVEISNLVKNFPVRSSGVFRRSVGSVSAVADVNFAVGRGETFGLVGESGCGKTTIGRLVVGLETPTSGSVTFPDVDLSVGKGKKSNAQAVARQRQMMFQDPYSSLDPRMRVGSIISEPLDIQEIGNKKERTERVRGLLAEVGLPPDAMERFPHEFSGGQRQRIGLARALALEPQLIVADEPVSALDVSIQAQILNLLQDLQEKHALSYILISHDLAVVKHASDRIGVMYLGKLVEVGPSEEIFTNPAHHYTRALLDAVPVPDVARARARLNQVVSGEIPSAINPPSGCRFRTRCPAATDRCAAEEPMMEDVATGHTVACHFPLRKVAASMSSAAQQ
jgi:oligopeptide/dipeptide ABC transporter ATP-binding protein